MGVLQESIGRIGDWPGRQNMDARARRDDSHPPSREARRGRWDYDVTERTAVGNLATARRPWHCGAMANVEKLSVALTPDMVAEVRAAVQGGD
jgi:hypothetical protein